METIETCEEHEELHRAQDGTLDATREALIHYDMQNTKP